MKSLSSPSRISRLPFYRLLLGCCAALGAASAAHAVCTPSATVVCIADQPIKSANIVKPNVMFILDNSGSMVWDFMPDAMETILDATRRNFESNTIYYNPDTNYTAAIPKRPDPSTGAIVSMGSQSFTSAQTDPFADPGTKINLSTDFRSYAESLSGRSPYFAADIKRPAFYCKKVSGTKVGTKPCNMEGYEYVAVGANSCSPVNPPTQCPTGADERVNFANWYSYSRTRILMMKSGMASAFAPLGDKFRVGLYTINSPTGGGSAGAAMDLKDFSGGESDSNKGKWYSTLFGLAPNGGTPLQEALDSIGRYYSKSAPPGLTTNPDPVQYSCQKNFAILSTDGGWNQKIEHDRKDMDKTVPDTMPIREGSSVYDPAAVEKMEPGVQFPSPYYEGAEPNTNTLADIAMYFWVRDLRTTGTVAPNNVPPFGGDPAYWQHMNTFTIGLGVNGTLVHPTDWGDLVKGVKVWPKTPSGGDGGTKDPSKFDDLWHAAVNGHGQYYQANNPTSLVSGLTAALKSIEDTASFGVGAASSTSDFKSPDQTDYTTYASSYRPSNWSGDVMKYAVDRATGLKTGSALWSASKQLDTKVNPGLKATVDKTAYTTRNIVTRNGATAVEFAYANLSDPQKTALCYKASPGTGPCIDTPTADQESLVNFLRGDATFEGNYGDVGMRFRNRHDVAETTYYKRDLIGSIVNAKPAYVAADQRPYQEGTDPGYTDFKKTTLKRTPALYVPANDGMVHALKAATGDELWAYIPSFLIATGLDENGYEKGLRALSYQDGGAPAYNHHFYVDATPEVGAVDFARSVGTPITAESPSGTWRSILVGGLGKGGNGYYALNVTAAATDLSTAQSAVLWEFPSAADDSHKGVISGNQMGFSFGRPIIAKTDLWGWVVIVPSGYNNHPKADGLGRLFVLNAKTGALLHTFATTEAAPGLAHVTMLAKTSNKVVKQAYAGDLNGNLWRFNLEKSLAATVPEVVKIFKSSSSTPITSEPNVSIDTNTGDRWVFFGTGKYLDVADRTTSIGKQYLVALRDGKVDSPEVPLSIDDLTTLATVSDLLKGVASAPTGWQYELTNAGERIVSKPVADLRTVVFPSTIPTTDPCSPGVKGNAYGLEYSTGKSRLLYPNGTLRAWFPSDTGIAGIEFQTTGKDTSTNSTGTSQLVIQTKSGDSLRVGLDTSKINSGTRHVGWRELLNEY